MAHYRATSYSRDIGINNASKMEVNISVPLFRDEIEAARCHYGFEHGRQVLANGVRGALF